VTKRVKLTLEELKRAEPLPHFYDGSWEVEDPRILMWVIENADSWRPRRVKSKGEWIEPVTFNVFKYLGAVWVDDKIYLVDEEAYSILHDVTGDKTANELIFNLIVEGVEYIKRTRGSNHEFVKIIERGDYKNEKLQGLLALYYRHLAMLKEKGLLI